MGETRKNQPPEALLQTRACAGAVVLPPGVPRGGKEPSGLEADATIVCRRRCHCLPERSRRGRPRRLRRLPCPPRRRCGPCWTSSWARLGTVQCIFACLHQSARELQKASCSSSRDETRQRVKFTDDRVCKSHLLDCCPHDILAGTAMDHLESFIAECDRRTELAKKRLAETQEEISAEVSAKAEKVHELNEEIGKLLAKAEQLGAEGNVDESQKILMEVEKVRAKKKEAEEEYRNSMPASSFQQQKLRVCEVCSAYLGLHDNDRRLADHFGGKLHLGFIQIREKLDQLRKTVAEKQEKRNQDRLRRREEREREERLSRRSGSRTRDRRRSRSRDRRRRRSRSTSRERRKLSRSRSRDRHRRHRSRSRSHSRGHRRASRDRSAKYKFSRERASREESWESGRSERGPPDWRLESSNGKMASRRSEEKEAGEI
ncbi:putative RNA-binding protein Luc7-like 1 isoform X3 [Pongo pygmaeus]|uniref:putative RNA-binding protein Luc7-like 1 isoform X3 n=1 Tax=Pongo pygmaeus TaxID=9600 RepID=UPI00300C8348